MPFQVLCLGALLLSPYQASAQTRQAQFLAWKDTAYVPSPTFAVKPASVYERFKWSPDGTRLAFVSPTTLDTPSRIDKRLTAGENPEGVLRVGVWSRDTGRPREVFVPSSDGTSIDDFTFMGRELLFSTQSSHGGQVWLVRDGGGTATPIELPGLESAPKLLASRRRQAVIVVGSKKAWLIDTARRIEIRAAGLRPVIGRGITADDRAIVMMLNAQEKTVWALVDFVSGAVETVDQMPADGKGHGSPPFVIDAYELAGLKKADLLDDDSSRVDSKLGYISDEDGGFRVDLVERSGAVRRRIPFIHEGARTVEISENGLAFAFVSNRTLMVRWMVPTDKATSARLLGAG